MHLASTTWEAIVHAIIESLASHKIDITKVCGQSYDGAQCMSSAKVFVTTYLRISKVDLINSEN